VFTSRISQQKRPVDAVRIFAEGTHEHPDAMFAMVGDGDQRGEVETEVERLGLADRVILTGYRTDINNWLAAATVWLFPTERENFSVALLEALAARCTVLATDAPGNDEILNDNVNALTFGIGDVSSAAAALSRLLDDPGLRERLAEQGKRDVSALSPEELLDRHLALYDVVMRGAARRGGRTRTLSRQHPSS
jgi:glycosyltransferase involved in cell wall biosynthesis